MKNTVLMSSLAVAIVLGGVSQGFAGSGKGGHGPHHSFEELDINSDGQISREEMAGHMQKRFEGADTNSDGNLSRDELVERIKERKAKKEEKYADHMMERHDANGDGVLSVDEMSEKREGRLEKMFVKVDVDENGTISVEEFEAMKKHHGKKKHKKHEPEAE